MSDAIPKDWLDDLKRMLASRQRVVLGLAGTPGAGKSSLAASLADAYGKDAVVVPMDGFHLSNAQLARLGLSHRKGAPQTFDVSGYGALLARIRTAWPGEVIYAPAFHREIEEPVAGAIAVTPDHRLIITEGNYLLFDQGDWAGVRPMLDACWFVDINPDTRMQRLVNRHMHFGRSAEAARNWVQSNDELNAVEVEKTRPRADRLVQWPAVPKS